MAQTILKTYIVDPAIPDDPGNLTEYATRHRAGNVVDRRARRYMETHGEKSYAKAMASVLDADPQLKQRYLMGEVG